MSTTAPSKTIRVAVVGNPNTGKSTLFTALAGVRQRVGNYPGVTVEKKTGHLRHDGQTFELIDLPGTYSLAPRSPDEMVAVDVLLGRGAGDPPPDVVLSIVDASNLERNLFLDEPGARARAADGRGAEHGRPGARSADRDRRAGAGRAAGRAGRADPGQPARRARRVEGRAGRGGHASSRATRENPLPDEFQRHAREIGESLNASRAEPLPHFLVERLLLDGGGYLEGELLNGDAAAATAKLAVRPRALAAAGMPVPAVEAMARYDWVARTLAGHRPPARTSTSGRSATGSTRC